MSARPLTSWIGVALALTLATSCEQDPSAAGGARPAASSSGGEATAPAGDDGTPVVLIVVDTLRADHLGCYGYQRDTSPNLDRLAADSILFRHAYSHAPWTTPSIGALMASMYPSTLGIRDVRSILGKEVVLLAEVLQQAGYTTGAAISHNFCSAEWGFDQGFAWFDESNIVGHDQICSPGITDRGLDFLDQHGREEFFLWLHYFDPHFAYLAHDAYPFRDGPSYEGPVQSGLPFGDLLRMRKRLTPADTAEIVRLYDSEVRLTDEHIGRVLDRLRADGLYDRSLIVFTADHGEEFLEHQRLGHTKTLYDEVLNVPLLVKLPHGEGRVVERPVGLVDVYPTIVELLGLDIDHEIAGRSLLKEPAGDRQRPVFFETTRKSVLRGMVLDDHKLIYDVEEDRYEMFDLTADPGEQENLYATRHRQARPLKARLQKWLDGIRVLTSEQRAGLSPEEIERLEALGYAVEDE